MIGAVGVSPAAGHLGLYVATLPDGSFDAGAAVGFLRTLLKHLRGKVAGVWDGGGSHKGPLVRAFLKRNRRLTLERLPAYAPDPNPVEAVGSWLKYGRRADYVPEGIPDLEVEASDRLIELKHDAEFLRALWGRSDLPFPQDGA